MLLIVYLDFDQHFLIWHIIFVLKKQGLKSYIQMPLIFKHWSSIVHLESIPFSILDLLVLVSFLIHNEKLFFIIAFKMKETYRLPQHLMWHIPVYLITGIWNDSKATKKQFFSSLEQGFSNALHSFYIICFPPPP